MRLRLATLTLSLLSFNIFAIEEDACHKKLLGIHDHSSNRLVNSKAYIVDKYDISGEEDFVMDEDSAEKGARIIMKSVGCTQFETIQLDSICERLPSNKVCEVANKEIGYFVVTPDFVDNVNIIFNRHD